MTQGKTIFKVKEKECDWIQIEIISFGEIGIDIDINIDNYSEYSSIRLDKQHAIDLANKILSQFKE